MKNIIKLLVLALGITGAQAQSTTASLTINTAPGLYLILTNRAKVYSVETASTNAAAFRLWDNDNTNNVPNFTGNGWAGTNYVNGSYISRSTFQTNYTSSYTTAVGLVSLYTNTGLWSVTSTNSAATNAVSPLVTVANGTAETRVTYVDALFTRGVIVHATGNGTITLYYRQDGN